MIDRLLAAARAVLAVVNPLGWLLLALGVLLVLTGLWGGWREMLVIGCAAVLAALLCLPFLVGRTNVAVTLLVDPERVIAGQSASVGFAVTNRAKGRLLSTILELPVGAGVHRYGLPSLAGGARHEERFTLRTARRGVIAVGPATTRRGDPLGAFSRDVQWTERIEVLVRPPLVPLDSLGAGIMRDLEGVTTDAISQSDLAFHALREYIPGDDLRHVHWRSSAKAMASGGDSQLLVRQYLDTRRSHATVVVDDLAESWGSPEDYETAMSVAASITLRATLDDFDTSFLSGEQAVSGSDGNRTLDAVCRAVPGSRGLLATSREAAQVAPDTSLLFLISGRACAFETFQRAALVFPPEVRTFAVIVDPDTQSRVTDAGGVPVLRLAAKEDLGPLLLWSLS